MFALVRKWASHLIHKHGQKFVKEVPEELLQFSLSSCSVELPRLDLQERLFENLDVLLPFEVSSAYLEDVAVFLRWRGSSCTIAVEARLLVVRGRMRAFQDWENVLRSHAPELQSREAAQSFKAAALKAHEEEILDLARRLLGTAVLDQSGSLPDVEFKLGGDPSLRDGDWGFQLLLEEDSGQISLTGSGFEICDGVNLNEILNDSQAWRLDFRLKGLMASCKVEERSTPCIGPCEELALEFTFAQTRQVKSHVELPKWPKRSMTQAFEMDELPRVSLAVCSTSCPVRASLSQVAFFTSHGLSWGRWFAFREALAVSLCQPEQGEEGEEGQAEEGSHVIPQSSSSSSTGAGSRYQRKWLLRLAQMLDASSVQANPEMGQVEVLSQDPYVASIEENQPLRQTLRERRLALLKPSGVDEENRGLVIASQRCMCSETRTSYDMLLTDPTARHTFTLMVNLTCSEVELLSDSSSLAVLPISVNSSIVVDLGVHDALDLKPLSLRLLLSDVELRRRAISSIAVSRESREQRDSTLSQRSSASGGASSSLGSNSVGAWNRLGLGGFNEPPLLRVVGLTTMTMDLTEPDDAELAEIRSPRWYLDVGGLLQACISYPLLLDVLELVGQLQEELLEVTSEEEEILLRQDSEPHRPRRSSLMYMPVSLEEGWEEEVDNSALVEILAAIRRTSPELTSPSSCSTDLRMSAVSAPLTVLVPCARTIDGAEDRVLGATLEGLLVMQLRLQCEPTENPLKEEEVSSSNGMRHAESHAVSSQRFCARQISAWLLPEDPARHLLKTSFADVDLTQHRGRPLLLSCDKVSGRISQEKELHLSFNLSELIFHVSSSDAVLLSLLLGSLGSASGRAAEEEPPPEAPRRTTLDLVAAGVSLRLLHASAKREASLKVLARLDIGVQEIHMVSEEKVELLLYSLQHVLLSDYKQEVTLVRFFGEESQQCAKLRLGSGAGHAREASVLLGHLQILAHWNLCSSLLVSLVLMKSAVAAAQGRQMASSASSSSPSWKFAGRSQKDGAAGSLAADHVLRANLWRRTGGKGWPFTELPWGAPRTTMVRVSACSLERSGASGAVGDANRWRPSGRPGMGLDRGFPWRGYQVRIPWLAPNVARGSLVNWMHASKELPSLSRRQTLRPQDSPSSVRASF